MTRWIVSRRCETGNERGIALHPLDLGGSAFNSVSALDRFFVRVMAGAAKMEGNLILEWTKIARLSYKRSQSEKLTIGRGCKPFSRELTALGQGHSCCMGLDF